MNRLVTTMLLFCCIGCGVVDLENPWEVYYRAEKYGTDIESITKHFNMHRGRWWNYYTRGACYLEHGHYQKARDDFAEAIKVRQDEARDARTYGMHFVDYFPHRETGIAFYLEGKGMTGPNINQETIRPRQVGLFQQAEAELEASLGQEESARAKYYLNQTRKAFWQANQTDSLAPVIQVKRSIHTNERIMQLRITVTDDRSGVAEIRIHALNPGARIDRPSILVELAQPEFTEEVELSIDSQEQGAVVEIEASDLAGNWSDPSKIHITLDTHAPMAAVSYIGDMGKGRFSALVQAVDDFGLYEIRAGGDQGDPLYCHGEKQYRGTVSGTPVGRELPIRVEDMAGNVVVTSVPIRGSSSRAPMPRAPWQRARWMFPLMERSPANTWDRCFSSGHLTALSVYQPSRPVVLDLSRAVQTASLRSLGVWTIGNATGQNKPQFSFLPYVRRLDGEPKETSQEFFVVQGTLHNAESVTRINVAGIDIGRDVLKKFPLQRDDMLGFSQAVALTHFPIDRKRPIRVRAFRNEDECADETLWVIRRRNCVRDNDAVYNAVLLLRTVPTAYRQTILDGVVPKGIYDDVFASLTTLRTPDQYGLEPFKRLSMHDVRSVWNRRPYRVAVKRTLDEVLERVRSGYDLVIHGDVGLWAGGGEEELAVTLRAMDLRDREDLEFQPLGTELPVVLAETRVPWKGRYERLDAQGRMKCMSVLTTNVKEKLPRIQAEAMLAAARAGRSEMRIDCGTDRRLFPGMSLCFYAYGDTARDANVYLQRIGQGRITKPDKKSSRVRPQLNLALVEGDLMAITK